tara:strand:- start:124 stop:294 length:171 start_codon:yes stop_codon:yes gene_type:complete
MFITVDIVFGIEFVWFGCVCNDRFVFAWVGIVGFMSEFKNFNFQILGNLYEILGFI